MSLSDRSSATRRAQAAGWLLARFGEHGIDAETHEYGTGANVVARVPATGPSLGTYVVGAHYDSVSGSPGADDNASGTAVVTALARWLNEVPCRSHDVLLVAFDQEEYGPPGSGGFGLVGSKAFAAKLLTDEEPVISVHTIDMIGWDGDGDRAIELARPDAGLFEFYDDVAADVPGLGPLYSTGSGSSDHVAFRGAGFDAVGILEAWDHDDTSPYYHGPNDRYDTVDFGYVAAAATLMNLAFGRAVGS
ncbi:MAG: M28 family peptidase [Deltaproteobacteria bacterium]|nr:M28 family peptidase [Nannocystaceae bacterium]